MHGQPPHKKHTHRKGDGCFCSVWVFSFILCSDVSYSHRGLVMFRHCLLHLSHFYMAPLSESMSLMQRLSIVKTYSLHFIVSILISCRQVVCSRKKNSVTTQPLTNAPLDVLIHNREPLHMHIERERESHISKQRLSLSKTKASQLICFTLFTARNTHKRLDKNDASIANNRQAC